MSKAKNAGNPMWSEKEINYLREICKQSLNTLELANKVNGKFWQGRPVRSSASVVGITERLNIHRNAKRDKWKSTKAIDSEILKLIDQGETQVSIGKIIGPKLNLDFKTVTKYIADLGKGKFFNPNMKKRKFSALELEKMLGHQNSGIDLMTLANKYGITYSNIRTLLASWRSVRKNIIKDIQANVDQDKTMRKYVLTEQEYKMFKMAVTDGDLLWNQDEAWTDSNADDILDLMEKATKAVNALEMRRSESQVRIKTDAKYIGIVGMGDWHLGSTYCDVKVLRENLALLKNTPNLYTVLVGDYIENAIPGGPHPGLVNEVIAPVKACRIAAEKLLSDIRTKILGMTSSCHLRWSIDLDDYDFAEHAAKKLHVNYMGQGGILDLSIVNSKNDITRTWKLAAMHKYGGGGVHKTNACRTYLMKENSECDAVFIGHNHVGAIHLEDFLGKKRAFVRTGVQKGADRYLDFLNITPQEDHGTPVIIVSTTNGDMQGFTSLQKGIEILTALNKAR